jgi:hypothetical protein
LADAVGYRHRLIDGRLSVFRVVLAEIAEAAREAAIGGERAKVFGFALKLFSAPLSDGRGIAEDRDDDEADQRVAEAVEFGLSTERFETSEERFR